MMRDTYPDPISCHLPYYARVTANSEVIPGDLIAQLLPGCRPSRSYRVVARIEMLNTATSTVCAFYVQAPGQRTMLGANLCVSRLVFFLVNT
jgi:hypothetical protein